MNINIENLKYHLNNFIELNPKITKKHIRHIIFRTYKIKKAIDTYNRIDKEIQKGLGYIVKIREYLQLIDNQTLLTKEKLPNIQKQSFKPRASFNRSLMNINYNFSQNNTLIKMLKILQINIHTKNIYKKDIPIKKIVIV